MGVAYSVRDSPTPLYVLSMIDMTSICLSAFFLAKNQGQSSESHSTGSPGAVLAQEAQTR